MAKALNFVRKESSKNRYVWTRRIFLKTDKKSLRFQTYPDTCGRGLNRGSIRMQETF